MANVLVVDDMQDVADSFAEMLSLFGHNVRVAYSGTQALSEIDLCRPDVVLADLSMPVLDGFHLARRIRERCGAGIRLVAHTSHPRAVVASKLSKAGFDSFVSKSARPLELALAIHGRPGVFDLRAGLPDRRNSNRPRSSRRRSTDPFEHRQWA